MWYLDDTLTASHELVDALLTVGQKVKILSQSAGKKLPVSPLCGHLHNFQVWRMACWGKLGSIKIWGFSDEEALPLSTSMVRRVWVPRGGSRLQCCFHRIQTQIPRVQWQQCLAQVFEEVQEPHGHWIKWFGSLVVELLGAAWHRHLRRKSSPARERVQEQEAASQS